MTIQSNCSMSPPFDSTKTLMHSSSSLSKSSVSSESSSNGRPRRVRGMTLRAGTSLHDAFFGQDDTLRENFDQVAACVETCNDRSLGHRRERQNSSSSAALLYLVTEELLKEAHEEKETTFSTSMFFLGFLIILLLK